VSASAADRETSSASVAVDASRAYRIEASGLTKRYGMRTVLRSVDLAVEAGERVVLFGPNGAGKTTLLRVLSTLTRPASGSLRINDLDIESDASKVRSQIGVLAHQPYVYDSLTARENLQFFARMFEVANANERIKNVLETVGLLDRADDRVGTFSRGMLQRIAIARAILHSPPILLFDEPDTGLDPSSVRMLESIVADHATSNGTVLMTTHDLGFGLRSADRALVMVNGRIVVDRATADVDPNMIESVMGARGE
jgi:heme ABC exporter ATP-binding subunit CcmA